MPDSDKISEQDERRGAAAPLIVAIGASAGGLKAFQASFAAMPDDSGMAFVLIQHLDPHHPSLLREILARDIAMPITEAADGMAVEPGAIYLIPPDATLTIGGGCLRVERPAPPRQHRWPVNSFFMALAEDQGENAVGIVLSGIGSDGASGITAIKAQGGLTLAQSEYDHVAMSGMPGSAAATGAVDFVLGVEEMPARLLRYRNTLGGAASRKNGDGLRQDAGGALPIIIGLLHARLGHDFTGYKTSTVIRRIQRRMQVLGIDSMEAFIERLRAEPAQLDLLFRELLIGVTEFMRDPDAFAALREQAVPGLLKEHGAAPLRAWVPGCSTGEEVYSLAILLHEAAEQAGITPKFQIFGTDIDETAIAAARAGVYPAPMRGLSADRTARWFTAADDHFKVSRALRAMCIFSVHNLVKDPPFSRLHLVSCRNLLIYMDSGLQDWVAQAFHYALRPGGILFLGPSENLSRSPRLFTTLDRKHRLYQRLPGAAHAVPQARPRESLQLAAPEPPRPAPPRGEDRIDRLARAALERFAPAYLVVNGQHDILRFSGGETGRYLEPSEGAASLALFTNLRKSLRPVVRAALQAAAKGRQPVIHDQVPLEIDGGLRTVSVIIETVDAEQPEGEPIYVVAFRDLQPVRRRGGKAGSADGGAALAAMEAELLATRARLQTALEAAETAGEETRSSVEEYQSVNEELQSTNEELETAKEEMHSINEELQTINAELNIKNEMLGRLNNDVQNLLESTRIATVFLDAELRIKSFTPALRALFPVRSSDEGRPLSDIAGDPAFAGLWDDIKAVARGETPREQEVRLTDRSKTFIARIMPYAIGESGTDGIVLTFVDITRQKDTEQTLRDQNAAIEFADEASFALALDGTVRSWNPAAERLFGYTAAEAVGQNSGMLCGDDRLAEHEALMEKARAGAIAGPVETVRQGRNGAIEIELTVVPILGDTGEVVALAGAARDIAARKQAERHRTLLLHELSHRVKNTLASVQSMAVQTLRNTKTLDDFHDAFIARLLALASTHDLLTATDWQGARLRDVIEAELKPYQPKDRTRWTIAGPEVRLDPKIALAFGMAFHELATNAVKYGALSVPGGRLDIRWRLAVADKARRLHLAWTEQGGPRVTPPERRGFGSRLISDGLAYELDGQVEMIFDPAGLRCVIDVPLVSKEDKL